MERQFALNAEFVDLRRGRYLLWELRDITERRRAEEALRRYELLARYSRDIVLFVRRDDGRILDANVAALRAYGYDREELLSHVIDDLRFSDTRALIEEQMDASDSLGLQFETVHQRKDGSTFSVEVSSVGATIGGVRTLMSVVRDITERKQAEKEIALLKHSIDVHYDAAYWTDIDGKFIYVNEIGRKVLGFESGEIVGRTILDINPQATSERMRAVWDKLRKDGFHRSESIHQRKDGSSFPVEILTSYVQFGGQEYACGFARDIAERKHAEVALRESELRYRLLFNAIPESVLLIGTDARVVAANAASARLYGYESPQQLEGFYTPLLIAEKDRERATRIQEELLQGNEGPARQYTEVRRDGSEFVAEVTSKPLRGPQQEVLGYIGITRDITALVEAQGKLQESNELLSQFVRNSPIHAYIKSVAPTESRVLQASDSFRQMIGLSGSEMLGKTMGELFPPDLAAKITTDDWSVAATGQVLRLDEDLNGRTYETIKFPVVLGDRTFLAGYSTDITERKRAEETTLETSRRLEFALRAGHLGVWDWNLKNNIMAWDDKMLALYGLTREQFPGGIEAWEQGLHPEDRARAIAECQAALDGSRDFDTEFRVLHPNGTVRHVKADGLVLRDEGGIPIRMLGVNQDITERKRMEELLRQEDARYRLTLESAPLAINITRGTGIVYANPSYLSLFGFSTLDELKEIPPLDLFAPDWRPKILKNIQDRAQGRAIPDFYEVECLRKDGTKFPITMYLARVLFTDGPAVIAFIIDISERKQSEAQKANLEAQLQQAQKMESVGRLAGGVAHDFNNMLGVILGHAEMAMEKASPADGALQGNLEEIRKAAERSANLTRQLLAFARKQTVAPKVLDLNETVGSMLKMLRRLVGEDVNLVWLPGAGLCPVKVDPSQIDQILANLCVNGRDAISGVGKLTIETANCAFDDDYCATHAEVVPGEYVRLAVTDDGCGMDKATQDRLFEPFFTTKELGKGTGLGLATVYGIVKQNNCFINVTSEPGKGARFEICLPRHVAAKTGPAQSEPLTGPAAGGHETILVVEDELAILDMTKTMLERLGYIVLAASTPGEAIRLAGAYTGVIHLLMTDVVMPEMNGRDLARDLLTSFPALKRLFMSGYTADVIAHQGVLDEGVHFIQKPFSKKDLAARVSEALERGSTDRG